MRQAIKRNVRNVKAKDKFKEAVKEVKKLIAAGKKSDAAKAMASVMSALDKAPRQTSFIKIRLQERKAD